MPIGLKNLGVGVVEEELRVLGRAFGNAGNHFRDDAFCSDFVDVEEPEDAGDFI